MSAVNLDDTSRCPLGRRCESCGDDHPAVAVRTATTPMGVLCVTLCQRCAASGEMPRVAVSTAAKLVLQHCQHIGVTVDEMGEALGGDR